MVMLGLFRGLNPVGCGGVSSMAGLAAIGFFAFAAFGGLISNMTAFGFGAGGNAAAAANDFLDEILILMDDCRLVFMAGDVESIFKCAVASVNC